MKDILDTAISTGSFTTLVTAARAAGLDETLKSEGPYTIFAPTDEAFAKLPPGTIDAWLSDVPTLISLLSYHIVPGKVLEDDVLEIEFAQTILGEELTIYLQYFPEAIRYAASKVGVVVEIDNPELIDG